MSKIISILLVFVISCSGGVIKNNKPVQKKTVSSKTVVKNLKQKMKFKSIAHYDFSHIPKIEFGGEPIEISDSMCSRLANDLYLQGFFADGEVLSVVPRFRKFFPIGGMLLLLHKTDKTRNISVSFHKKSRNIRVYLMSKATMFKYILKTDNSYYRKKIVKTKQ